MSSGAPVGFTRAVLFPAGTTAATIGTPVDCRALGAITVWAEGTGTISGGVCTVEMADYDPAVDQVYSGTWVSLGTITLSGASGGKQVVLILPAVATTAAECFGFVRGRISTEVSGGGSVKIVLTGRP